MAIIGQNRKTKKTGNMLSKINFEYGELWEKMYGSHGYKYRLPYAFIQPSGDPETDFIRFTQGQGGEKSNDPNDPAIQYMPTETDKDGNRWHTIHDMTYPFFTQNAPLVGIDPTVQNFYNCTKEQHAKIVDNYIQKTGKKYNIKSIPVKMVYIYAEWGSGQGNGVWGDKKYDYGALDLLGYYIDFYGMSVNESINEIGEYNTFTNSLMLRREQMKRETSGWKIYNRNWSSGLAHFHRVFKIYCKS